MCGLKFPNKLWPMLIYIYNVRLSNYLTNEVLFLQFSIERGKYNILKDNRKGLCRKKDSLQMDS